MMLASSLICDTATAHAACFTQFTGPEMQSMRLLIKGECATEKCWGTMLVKLVKNGLCTKTLEGQAGQPRGSHIFNRHLFMP